MAIQATDAERLAEFSRAVRQSSLKRLLAVPAGYENWCLRQWKMSFADLAQHLADCDRWLLRKLEVKDLDPIVGQAGGVQVDRAQYLQLLEELARLGERRAQLLGQMTEAQYAERIFDARFGGETSVWWIIVRDDLDHEIHHRGIIGLYLSLVQGDGRPRDSS